MQSRTAEPYLNSSCCSASWSIKIWSRSHLIRLHSLWKSNATYLLRERSIFSDYVHTIVKVSKPHREGLIYKTGSDRGFFFSLEMASSKYLLILSVLCNLPKAAPVACMVTAFTFLYKMPPVWGSTHSVPSYSFYIPASIFPPESTEGIRIWFHPPPPPILLPSSLPSNCIGNFSSLWNRHRCWNATFFTGMQQNSLNSSLETWVRFCLIS